MYGGQNATQTSLCATQILAATGFISPSAAPTNNLVFTADQDRHHFLTLVGTLSEERQVRVAAYTEMTNHFHLVAVGDRTAAISLFMMDLNGQYATFGNAI